MNARSHSFVQWACILTCAVNVGLDISSSIDGPSLKILKGQFDHPLIAFGRSSLPCTTRSERQRATRRAEFNAQDAQFFAKAERSAACERVLERASEKLCGRSLVSVLD